MYVVSSGVVDLEDFKDFSSGDCVVGILWACGFLKISDPTPKDIVPCAGDAAIPVGSTWRPGGPTLGPEWVVAWWKIGMSGVWGWSCGKKVCAAWFCACGGCQLEVPAKSDCAVWYTGTGAGTNGCVVGTYCCCWLVGSLYMV